MKPITAAFQGPSGELDAPEPLHVGVKGTVAIPGDSDIKGRHCRPPRGLVSESCSLEAALPLFTVRLQKGTWYCFFGPRSSCSVRAVFICFHLLFCPSWFQTTPHQTAWLAGSQIPAPGDSEVGGDDPPGAAGRRRLLSGEDPGPQLSMKDGADTALYHHAPSNGLLFHSGIFPALWGRPLVFRNLKSESG